ncbi:MAG: hypothetical protein GY945_15675 [Rhodobacteraceae bacterium]|nr:hypothetical protein [Paracoccaceae bacterium]
MGTTLQSLLARAREAQEQIEDELSRRRDALGLSMSNGRVVFEESMRQRHRAARIKLRDFLAATRPMVVLTAPLVYGLIVPLVLVDLTVTLYQLICFPVYGIARVRRRDHIFVDRHHLAYLNALQKLNCVYCGYANGLVSYTREVAGRTEAYWCPIKHARRVPGAHGQYAQFMEYGDEEDFIDRWVEERVGLKGKD